MEKLADRLSDTRDGTRARLASALGNVVDEAEQFLDHAQRSGGEQVDIAREKLAAQLVRARAELEALGDTASYRARQAARVTSRALHEHPYAAVGIAAGIGALLAAVLLRRR